MTRKLTRLQTLLAGGAFALASIGGITSAALADTTPTPASADTAAAASFSTRSVRASSTRSQPRAASPSANARPSPFEAPVMIATGMTAPSDSTCPQRRNGPARPASAAGR